MDAHADMDEAASESDPDEAPMPMPDDAGRIPVDNNYQAYTERFDEIIKAEELCDPDELMRLRQLLDQQLVSLQHATSKLANRLQRRLMAKQNRTWEFDLEEGILDAARLTQVVVDPMNPLAYKQHHFLTLQVGPCHYTLNSQNHRTKRGYVSIQHLHPPFPGPSVACNHEDNNEAQTGVDRRCCI